MKEESIKTKPSDKPFYHSKCVIYQIISIIVVEIYWLSTSLYINMVRELALTTGGGKRESVGGWSKNSTTTFWGDAGFPKPWYKNLVSFTIFGCPGHPETQ